MGIPKQKYNGRNPYNNRVIVDFDNRFVKFKPVGKTSIINQYIEWLYCVFILFIMYWVPFFFVLVILKESKLIPTIAGKLFTFLMLFLFPVIISLFYANKTWRHDKFPEANYHINHFFKRLFGKKDKTLTINKENLRDQQFVIPYFKNIMLEYKATGDFAKNLKRIEVKNIFKEDPYKWFVIFMFNGKCKKGNVKVKYL